MTAPRRALAERLDRVGPPDGYLDGSCRVIPTGRCAEHHARRPNPTPFVTLGETA